MVTEIVIPLYQPTLIFHYEYSIHFAAGQVYSYRQGYRAAEEKDRKAFLFGGDLEVTFGQRADGEGNK